jgi:hypothetical protein
VVNSNSTDSFPSGRGWRVRASWKLLEVERAAARAGTRLARSSIRMANHCCRPRARVEGMGGDKRPPPRPDPTIVPLLNRPLTLTRPRDAASLSSFGFGQCQCHLSTYILHLPHSSLSPRRSPLTVATNTSNHGGSSSTGPDPGHLGQSLLRQGEWLRLCFSLQQESGAAER